MNFFRLQSLQNAPREINNPSPDEHLGDADSRFSEKDRQYLTRVILFRTKHKQAITLEKHLLKSTTLQKTLSMRSLIVIDSWLQEKIANSFTPDANGEYHSAKACVSALEVISRNCLLPVGEKLDIETIDAKICAELLTRLSHKRGRVTPFDTKVAKTVRALRRFAGASDDGFDLLVKNLTRREVILSRPKIKANAEKYRDLLLAYSQSKTEISGPRSIVEARDKSIIALLCFSPFRENTLSLLRRDHVHERVFSIPANAMKGREQITFEIPDEVFFPLSTYLAMLPADSIWLFPSMRGTQLSTNAIFKALTKRSLQTLGVKVSPHNVRKIIASYASKRLGRPMAANLLTCSEEVLIRHYDLSDGGQRLTTSIQRLKDIT